MAKSLRERAETAAKEVQDILGVSEDSHPKEIADAIEHTITNALVEERNRCAEVALNFVDDRDKANLVSDEIKRINTALIANLSSMR